MPNYNSQTQLLLKFVKLLQIQEIHSTEHELVHCHSSIQQGSSQCDRYFMTIFVDLYYDKSRSMRIKAYRNHWKTTGVFLSHPSMSRTSYLLVQKSCDLDLGQFNVIQGQRSSKADVFFSLSTAIFKKTVHAVHISSINIYISKITKINHYITKSLHALNVLSVWPSVVLHLDCSVNHQILMEIRALHFPHSPQDTINSIHFNNGTWDMGKVR